MYISNSSLCSDLGGSKPIHFLDDILILMKNFGNSMNSIYSSEKGNVTMACSFINSFRLKNGMVREIYKKYIKWKSFHMKTEGEKIKGMDTGFTA